MRDRANARAGASAEPSQWSSETALLRSLGVGLHETLAYLYTDAPPFAAFEAWVLRHRTAPSVGDDGASASHVLDARDLSFFEEHGYVVVREAVTARACREAEGAIWSFLGMDRDDPASWYAGPHGHSIWVPLLHHPAIWANRRAPRVRGAFEQLWQRDDLSSTVDQCGFNPPERDDWKFPGPRLHFDCALEAPVPFGLQGILYLTDTAEHQGAFICVPGFHRRIDGWLAERVRSGNPSDVDLGALESRPIAGKAGDLIVWHHALPHGSSPNRANRPRIVQYVTFEPQR